MQTAHLNYRKYAAWAILLLAGLVQTWHTRHRIFSDGISYLDIATYYAHGDWNRALNAYWSPMYSWLLAIPLRLFSINGYWDVTLIHLVNFVGFIFSLLMFELLLTELLNYRAGMLDSASRISPLFSDWTIRATGYCVFAIAELHLIGIGYCSPDMMATATGFYIAYVLCTIAAGRARRTHFVGLGIAMGLTYLARASFAPMILVNLATIGSLRWKRRQPWLLPVCLVCAAVGATIIPWIAVLSFSRGHMTLGEAGRLNYGWEVGGAARSTHWQGEPYNNIGVPKHPTHREIDHPATYTFTNPVPGSYPPWYDPSYWYDGIAPHFELGRQLKVLRFSIPLDLYLVLLSPVTVPCIILAFWTGWQIWISKSGLRAYWFLIIPSLLYIGAYSLVYMDRRYIAGSLAVLWLCLAASMVSRSAFVTRYLNTMMSLWVVFFALAYVGFGLLRPTKLALIDLVHGAEAEWNLQWMLAQNIQKLGVEPGSEVAYIGEAINSEWARLDHIRIVAEVPVIWDRLNNINRGILANHREAIVFWKSKAVERLRVLNAFQAAGASMVFADPPPPGTDTTGWRPVLPPDASHLPWSGGQVPVVPGLMYYRLTSSSSQTR